MNCDGSMAGSNMNKQISSVCKPHAGWQNAASPSQVSVPGCLCHEVDHLLCDSSPSPVLQSHRGASSSGALTWAGVAIMVMLGVVVFGSAMVLQSCASSEVTPPPTDLDTGTSYPYPDTGNHYPGPTDTGTTTVEDTGPTGDQDCREFVQIGQVYTVHAFADLAGLECVNRIAGNLIVQAPDITSISLPKLREIGGNLLLGASMDQWLNSTLATVSLPGLETIGGNFSIRGNPVLTTVTLPELTTIGGDLIISEDLEVRNNDMLSTVNLGRVNGIGGQVLVRRNAQLTQMGLGSLSSLGKALTFFGNHKLCHSSLQSIADRLRGMGWTGNLTLMDNGDC